MNKKLLCVCALSLLLTGCGEVAKLNITTTEPITIDATEKLDPTVYLKDLDKNATVDYEIKDNEMVITLTKGNKTKDITIPVEVNEPKVSVDRHIEVDKYVGYDLEQYIHEDEGVSHTIDFDEDTGKLSVTFTKGEWTKVIDDDVTVLDSNPINNWPKKYACQEGSDTSRTRILEEDGTQCLIDHDDNIPYYGTYKYNDNNTFYFYHTDIVDYLDGYPNVKGDYEQFVITYPTADGYSKETCTLIK